MIQAGAIIFLSIPWSLRIATRSDSDIGVDNLAVSSPLKRTITIQEGNVEQTVQLLIHEALHVGENYLEIDLPEETVRRMAHFLFDTLHRNGLLNEEVLQEDFWAKVPRSNP